MLFIIHTLKGSTKEVKSFSDDAVEAVATAKKLYRSATVKSAGVIHQSGWPIYWRNKTRRDGWVN